MREIARVSQGFFPTQDRIVRAVAKLFKFPTAASPLVVLDAGCGTGQALHDLRSHWLAQQPFPKPRKSVWDSPSRKLHRHSCAGCRIEIRSQMPRCATLSTHKRNAR